MRLRRFGVVAVAVAAVGLLGTACEPPMEITLGVSRTATLNESTNDITFRGTVACTRGGEPVDIWIDIVQDGVSGSWGSIGVGCEGPDPVPWSVTYPFAEHFHTGSFERLEVTGCTNPSRQIDEDCVLVTRTFGLQLVAG